MRFIILLIFIGFSSIYAQEKLSKNQLIQDLEVLENNLKAYHTGLYTYTSKDELHRWFEATKQQLQDSTTAYEFFRRLGQLNSVIKNGHTFVHINPAQREPNLKMPAFSIYTYKNSFYIKDISIKEYKHLIGKQITTINGENIADVFNTLMQYKTRDGNNLTMPKEQLLHSFAFTYALVYGTKEQTTLVIHDETNTTDVTLPNITASLEESNAEKLYETGKISFNIKDSIAFLRVPTFYEVPLKKDQYTSKLKAIFKRIKKEEIKHLIIDVRNNGGGNTPMVEALISYIYDQEFTFYDQIYQLHNKWDKNIIPEISEYSEIRMGWTYLKKDKQGFYQTTVGDGLKTIKPKSNVYRGKLYVLTNGNSLSAAAEFASFVKHHRPTTLIGEEPGGNKTQNTSGDWLRMALPNSKLVMAIPYILWKMNVDFNNDGHGIPPDHWVRNTITDELNDTDRVLEFTTRLIKKSMTNTL